MNTVEGLDSLFDGSGFASNLPSNISPVSLDGDFFGEVKNGKRNRDDEEIGSNARESESKTGKRLDDGKRKLSTEPVT